MPNLLTSLEVDLYWLCGIAGLGTLAYALYNMLLAQSRPVGHRTGSARQVLRTRYLVSSHPHLSLHRVYFVETYSAQAPLVVAASRQHLGSGDLPG